MVARAGARLEEPFTARAGLRTDGARTARRTVRAALVVLIALLVASVAAAAVSVRRIYTLANTRYLEQAAPIYAATQDVLVEMLNQDTAVRGYLISGDPSTLEPYREGRAREAAELAQIAANASSDPRVPAHLAAVRRDVAWLERFYAHQIALFRSGPAGQRQARREVLNGKARFDHFRLLALQLEADAGRVVERARSAQHGTFVNALVFVIAIGALAVAIALTLLLRVPERLYHLYRAEEEARRGAEEGAEAARALAHVGEAVILVDDSDTVRYWNPAAEHLLGLSGSAVVGRALAAATPAVDRALEATRGGEPAAVTIDDRRRWLESAESRFEGGRVIVLRDLTESRELERIRADFVATAAHELRTPLAAIYGAVRTLLREDHHLPDATRARFLAMIESESERLRRLMDQLLVTAQLDGETLVVHCETVDLCALCRSLVDSTGLQLPETFDLSVDIPTAPLDVTADPERLRQAIGNLLENAIKYSPDGGRIEVRVGARDGRAHVEIADSGIGIPPEEQERIFDKFYRLDPTMTRGVGGSGLGLYIIRQVVERMGGEVGVDSELGKGSTFTIALQRA